MRMATHRVGSRHFTFGEWREPGTLINASEWPNRLVLEESGYIVPLASPAPLEDATAKAKRARRPPTVEKPSAAEQRPPEAPAEVQPQPGASDVAGTVPETAPAIVPLEASVPPGEPPTAQTPPVAEPLAPAPPAEAPHSAPDLAGRESVTETAPLKVRGKPTKSKPKKKGQRGGA